MDPWQQILESLTTMVYMATDSGILDNHVSMATKISLTTMVSLATDSGIFDNHVTHGKY